MLESVPRLPKFRSSMGECTQKPVSGRTGMEGRRGDWEEINVRGIGSPLASHFGVGPG